MTTRQNVSRECALIGATVTDDSNRRAYQYAVEAPPGKVWIANGCHFYGAWIYRGPWSIEPMWCDLFECVAMGLRDCDDEMCDFCRPETED